MTVIKDMPVNERIFTAIGHCKVPEIYDLADLSACYQEMFHDVLVAPTNVWNAPPILYIELIFGSARPEISQYIDYK